MGIAGLQLALAKRQGQLSGQGTGDAHYADAATALSCRDGGNGFTGC
jgi:hypothetical protein